VVPTTGFGGLSAEWPEVMLKINIFLANLSENSASSAIEAYKQSRQKRSSSDAEELTVDSSKRRRTD